MQSLKGNRFNVAENDVGDRIRIARKMHNLTQKNLGDLIGISLSMISHLETYSYKTAPSSKRLDKICDVLGLNIAWLKTGKGEMWSGEPAKIPPKMQNKKYKIRYPKGTKKDTTSIGGRVRGARINAGFSQAQLASKIGCSQASVYKIENNTKPDVQEFLPSIAKVCNVDYNWLAIGEKEMDLAG